MKIRTSKGLAAALFVAPLLAITLHPTGAYAAETQPVDEGVGVERTSGESVGVTPYSFNANGTLDVDASVAMFASSLDALQPQAAADGISHEAWGAMRADALNTLSIALADPSIVAVIENEGTGSGSDSDDAAAAAAAARCNYSVVTSWSRHRYFFVVPTFSNYVVEGPFSCVGAAPIMCYITGYVIAAVPPTLISFPGSGLLNYGYACFAEGTSLAGVRPTTGAFLPFVLSTAGPVAFRARTIFIT